jgi:GT2 family glycosyltransferase
MDLISTRPTVSIVIPMRNEECHITQCLDAILVQDYPSELIDIVCVDGMSDDSTREIVRSYTDKYSDIQLLDNPQRIVPTAMNIGIQATKGDIVIRIDARCFVEPDYVSQCVHYLRETGAWNVGGPQQAEEQDDPVSETIALAMTSPFGIGGSKFHYSDEPQYVDTVYLGAYPRWVFDEVGLYDESLVRNQDYELNHRVCKAGGRIYFTPEIRSVYYGRASLGKLWEQYFQYGFWKVRVLKKHPDSLKWRHLVAPLFVASLGVSSLFSWLWIGRLVLLVIMFSYTTASAIASINALSDAEDRRSVLLLPLVFAILHLSWGLGFWWGLLNIFNPPSRIPWSGATDQ